MRNLLLEQTSSEDFLNRIGLLVEEKVESIFQKSLKNSGEDEFLTIDEVAKLLKVSRGSVYNYENLGYLKPVRIGNSKRFLKSAVVEFMGQTTII